MFSIARLLVITMFLIIGSFIAIVGGLSAPTLAAESYVTPPGVTLLTGDEIREALIGNRLVGSKWDEYYAKGNDPQRGAVIGRERGTFWYNGRWQIVDNRLCTTHDDLDYEGCFDVYLSEDRKQVSLVIRGKLDLEATIEDNGF